MIHTTDLQSVYIHSWPNCATIFISYDLVPVFNADTDCYSVQEIAEKYNLTPEQRKKLFKDLNKTF